LLGVKGGGRTGRELEGVASLGDFRADKEKALTTGWQEYTTSFI
jgi:hypothetical protein